MPIKVNVAMQHTILKKQQNSLFKNSNIQNNNIIIDNANNVMKNSNFSSFQCFVFKMVDKIMPIKNKHPKIYAEIIKISEKILNKTDCLKK